MLTMIIAAILGLGASIFAATTVTGAMLLDLAARLGEGLAIDQVILAATAFGVAAYVAGRAFFQIDRFNRASDVGAPPVAFASCRWNEHLPPVAAPPTASGQRQLR